MSNPSLEDRHYHRRRRFEQDYRELAARGVFKNQPSRSTVPAEVWVCVVFALIADFISRAFGWFRIIAYLTLAYSIYYLSPGAFPCFGIRHVFFDVIAGVALLRSVWLLLRREFSK